MFAQEKYQKAMHFAAKAHLGQKYPGEEYSYIVHISMVAMEIIGSIPYTKKSEVINWDLAVQCALLHDTIEDTTIEYKNLANFFNVDIANGVMALTKNTKLKKEDQMKDSLKRIKNQPKEIWLVKLADRITNLQKPPKYWSSEKKNNYKKEAIFIYNELKDSHEYISNRLNFQIKEYN